jgi:hypothetical protein
MNTTCPWAGRFWANVLYDINMADKKTISKVTPYRWSRCRTPFGVQRKKTFLKPSYRVNKRTWERYMR